MNEVVYYNYRKENSTTKVLIPITKQVYDLKNYIYYFKEVFDMKTTKKGFTLIELIVVIAIIGVLAAILVPSMLGYVKKSKIQSANSTASSIYKAVNSAATEFEEEDKCLKDGTGTVTVNNGSVSITISAGAQANSDEISSGADLVNAIVNYFGDIKKCNGAKFNVTGGMCNAVACKSGKYIGTYPSGVITAKNWGKSSTPSTIDAALSAAKVKAGS